MKRLLKKKSFWVVAVLAIVVIAIIGFLAAKNKSNIEYTTETVKRGNIAQTITATGAVDSSQDIDLSFKVSGRLVKLNVDEGDQIKAGQVLAGLDSAKLSALVSQYRANVSAARANLEKVVAGFSGEQLSVYQEKVAKAESDLSSVTATRDSDLNDLREKSINSLNNASFTMGVALDKVYNYFISDSQTAYLQVNNTSWQNKVESDYYLMEKNIETTQAEIRAVDKNQPNEKIADVSLKTITALNQINAFLDDVFKLADAIIVNNSYPQTTKDAIKADVITQQSNCNTAVNSVQTAKSNLVSAVDSYDSQIKAAESALSIAKAELNLAQAGPRSFEIGAAQASIDQAQAQLNQALADLTDYSIVAPIDGTVTKVDYSVGEQVVASQKAIKMLSTEKYEINVDIAESDITKLAVGQAAVIELDAFGADKILQGKVVFIDPAQTVIQDVIYYKTKISLASNPDAEKIKPGMTADVTITGTTKSDVLYVPQRAVKLRETVLGEVSKKYVEVMVGENKIEERDVEIGLRGDGGYVEILSGLNEGEKVVTFKKTI